MHQYVWLEFYRGKRHLLPGNQTDRVRIWVDRQAALSALIKEGWEVSGPYPKQFPFKKKPWERFYGYGLVRTVHLFAVSRNGTAESNLGRDSWHRKGLGYQDLCFVEEGNSVGAVAEPIAYISFKSNRFWRLEFTLVRLQNRKKSRLLVLIQIA